MDYADSEDFLKTPAYLDYVKRIADKAGAAQTSNADPFLKDNFLSTDIRIPITLVGTNYWPGGRYQRHARPGLGQLLV